ncbi:5d690aee-2ed0-4170-bf39-2259aa5714d5 [Sclerotinia trifoliorum]|uniref:5d690aee-2ed0-4170-bf39-2259aa5714d5 n=1 Tax=Sclerotinia trifoliorum TaxID=28548 RepID=A0A8H2ZRH8_9HELO|nr:5d690aee-2ed0-4170-bf39-2259aa5714d5 [Sclerotinia trifoliorum]
MPVIALASVNNTIANNIATNATSDVLQVVCAWPVSGQYGPGSRVLYYVLVAACVFLRKQQWLKEACLAAALLFPAVAAIHGIVLAAVHVDGAVDMDIYGAFQLCSIGILAAPITVKLSRTYFFETPGRNTIFLWTGLIFAGLLSLTVEFTRISTSPCTTDSNGQPAHFTLGNFTYDSTCSLTCDVVSGPFSPMRRGSANNIYVIPAPDKLTFDTITLLSAACCIPAILSLVSMWNKIRETNWNNRFGRKEEPIDAPIEGTNNATLGQMKEVNSLIRFFLSAIEVPVFVGAVVTILILGEGNFFSRQVAYQTEPIATIGQWAPIVGTALAVFGSLYRLFAANMEADDENVISNAPKHHDFPKRGIGLGIGPGSPTSIAPRAIEMMHQSVSDSSARTSHEIEHHEIAPTTSSRPSLALAKLSSDVGNRRKVATVLTAIGNYIGTAAEFRLDDSEFKHGKAVDFPEIPGEDQRNAKLPHIREAYNHTRDVDGNITPMLRPSRAPSINGSIISGLDIEASTGTGEPASPRSPASHFSASPANGDRPRLRRDTLEVPPQVHHSLTRYDTSRSESQVSPVIVVSSETTDVPSLVHPPTPPKPPAPP